MDTERHAYLVSRGYAVREIRGLYYLRQNGETVSGPHATREAAWSAADDDSYVRAMGAVAPLRATVRTCVAPVSDDADPILCGKPATEERTAEGMVCALCAKHAHELDADSAS